MKGMHRLPELRLGSQEPTRIPICGGPRYVMNSPTPNDAWSRYSRWPGKGRRIWFRTRAASQAGPFHRSAESPRPKKR